MRKVVWSRDSQISLFNSCVPFVNIQQNRNLLFYFVFVHFDIPLTFLHELEPISYVIQAIVLSLSWNDLI